MTQWEKRVDLFKYIYTCLIHEYNSEEIKMNHIEHSYDFEASYLKVIEYIAINFDDIKTKIINNINKTWTWERLSYVDRSIMLCSVAEFVVLEIPKNIIIDQSLITAKNYNIDDSYKYINAILEKIL